MIRRLPLLACALLALPFSATATTLKIGCPWIPDAIDNGTQNSGYPDKAATYSIAALPTNPPTGATLVLKGTLPQLRYFSFQIADRDRNTPPYDQISDAVLVADEGTQPSANPADLPFAGNYTLHYTVTVRFTDIPAQRERNTLYAGTPQSGDPVKQLVMRSYLPNPGTDTFGNTPLPTLTLVTSTGTTSLDAASNTLTCRLYRSLWTHVPSVTNLVPAPTTPKFYVSSGGGLVLYPNADGTYIGAPIRQTVNDLIVVRSKAPSMPPVPPQRVLSPQVRYWSACENELQTTASVACIADRDMTVASDGYFTLVVSPDNLKPPSATSAKGYNWLPWGGTRDGLLVLRQFLPAPGFAGDYGRALAAPKLPLSQTIGEWAPDISYCDLATFEATAPQGGAAVLKACHAAAGD